ncbi:SDR family oxidoreductase [Streptomyces sp. NPDC051219]|uniref:SDR family NAD(P)-dependent oxidoreductase n=1 Tax=Streptomyces sp. NPDC051219 TaxID=3155283 RepID=UPI0034144600
MLLQDKTAVIYGAAGAVGSAVARTFAREGAKVFLAGRTLETLDTLAAEISAEGGETDVAQVDALDRQAVQEHADAVVEEAGSIDVSFNAIGIDHVQGTPLRELSPEDYSLPITTYTTTQFLTATAAARYMVSRGSGVILTLSATAARVTLPSDGFGVACAGVEAFSRQLAGELGPYGVRVVCLRPDAIPETAMLGSHARTVWSRAAERMGMTLEDVLDGSPGVPGPLLQRSPSLAEVADVAAFMASDRASAMTASVANISCGSVVD